MPRKLVIPKGTKFNRLTVLEELETKRYLNGQTKRIFLCKCVCGNELDAVLGNLRNGNTNSCGCYQEIQAARSEEKKTHGLSKHRLYAVYRGMHDRCYNKKNERYKDYGGRGITVCNRWSGKRGLQNFIDWNNKLPKHKQWKDGLQIDRRDNDGRYSPENCRWVTRTLNCSNRRTNVFYDYKGRKYTLRQLYDLIGNKDLKFTAVLNRIHRGTPVMRALTRSKNKDNANLKVGKRGK